MEARGARGRRGVQEEEEEGAEDWGASIKKHLLKQAFATSRDVRRVVVRERE